MGGPTETCREPRGIRNNNPGNIRSTPGGWWEGETGMDADGFVTFITPEFGLRALARLLRSYAADDDIHTIAELTARYSPGGATTEEAYAHFVSRQIGVSPAEHINVLVMTPLIMRAIVWFENGKDPYTRHQIRMAVEASDIGE